MAINSYVCLYSSYLETLKPFTDAEIGRIVMAMLTYAGTGQEPEFSGNERFIWPSIKSQIDRDQKAYQNKCEKNQLNGAKGGRPKNRTVISETERFSEKPKKAKEKENKNQREKGKENENINSSLPQDLEKVFTIPTMSEVQEYCQDRGYLIDSERFVNYYTSNGWMIGKNPMQDWKAAVRNWVSKEDSKYANRKNDIPRLTKIGLEV